MTFRPEYLGGCEAAKIAPLVVRYLQGKCLDIGAGVGKVWPSVLGIDTAMNGTRPASDLMMDGTDLSMFADGSMDGVFSSFLLHQFEPSKVPGILREWARVLKVGGHLVLYLPDAEEVPKGADPLQKWAPTVKDIEAHLHGVWDRLECERRVVDDEYGVLLVYELVSQDHADCINVFDWQRNPDGKKRALLIRYGAFGDAIVMASVFPHLKAQGYHVTVNCNPSTHDVLKHDPNVDDWIVQGKDFVPNEALGPYWQALTERYDHIINLSESVEGLLLALPGRLNHSYSDEARRRLCGHVNYLEHTHNIAAVPFGFDNARFHATEAERKWARAVRRQMSGPVIVWVINGSSAHKVYPWVQVVAAWLLKRTPAHIVLYGDPGVGKQLQDGILACLEQDGCDMGRATGIAGKWSIRQSLAFLDVADCVVGPETGPINAAGMLDVPKVVYLSHSSGDNLTKHWRNCTTVEPDAVKAPCYPCHRLHSDWTFCPKDEATGAAACASSISPDRLFKEIAGILVQKAAA